MCILKDVVLVNESCSNQCVSQNSTYKWQNLKLCLHTKHKLEYFVIDMVFTDSAEISLSIRNAVRHLQHLGKYNLIKKKHPLSIFIFISKNERRIISNKYIH